ncbi:MAG TPA: TQO small subunit DoxD [Limnochordia bacterium]
MWIALGRMLFAGLRIWLGWQWLGAGLHKVGAPAWTGEMAGTAVAGFAKGALAKAVGESAAVPGWYAMFLERWVIPHAPLFGHLVAYGELLVGIGLILGAFTGFAAIAGAWMNVNFMLAGAAGTNPILFAAAAAILAGLSLAQHYGIDAYLRPRVEGAARVGIHRLRLAWAKASS